MSSVLRRLADVEYGETGLTTHELVAEYVLGIGMECIAALFLLYDLFILSQSKAEYMAEKAGRREVRGGQDQLGRQETKGT